MRWGWISPGPLLELFLAPSPIGVYCVQGTNTQTSNSLKVGYHVGIPSPVGKHVDWLANRAVGSTLQQIPIVPPIDSFYNPPADRSFPTRVYEGRATEPWSFASFVTCQQFLPNRFNG